MSPVSPRLLVGLTLLIALVLTLQPTTTADSLSPTEQKVFDLVNQARASAGLPALRVDWRLVNAARAHNHLMLQRQKPSHQLDGEKPVCGGGDDRLRAAGYDWTFCAENIAAGQTSPEQVIHDWLNSPGHRANLLHPNARDIGVAYHTGGNYGTWWTQVFAAPAGQQGGGGGQAAAPPPAAQPSLLPSHSVAGQAALAEGERRQVIQFNPGAALQKRIFADGFVPNSGEFTVHLDGKSFTGQRAEHLASGRVRIYFVRVGDWGNVTFVERGAVSTVSLGQTLLTEGERRQVIQFNPGAALQKRIFSDGYVPNAPEFRFSVGGVELAAQRGEQLGTGRVRVYFVRVGDWRNILTIDR